MGTITLSETGRAEDAGVVTDDTLSLFLSHKSKDGATAEAIKSDLEVYGAGRLVIHLSEQIDKGVPWRPEIHKWLREADWLILLYTDPAEEWDWCLYETGFFAASHEKDHERLVCLYRQGDELPGPVTSWQAVAMTDPKRETRQDKCIEFLREVFCESPRPGVLPINPRIRERHLEDVANCIAGLYHRAEPKPVVFVPYLKLTLVQEQIAKLLETGTIPGSARISGDERGGALRILGLQASERWSQVSQRLAESNQQNWEQFLGSSLRRICQGLDASTTLPVLYLDRPASRWRPILYEQEEVPNTYRRFTIAFSEIQEEDDPRPAQTKLAHIISLIVLARMVRWGLIEKYQNQLTAWNGRRALGQPVPEKQIDEILGKVIPTLQRYNNEAWNAGVRSIDSVEDLFDQDQVDEKKRMHEMTGEWTGICGRLATSVKDKNLEQLSTVLNDLRRINREAAIMLGRQYVKLMERLW